MLEDSRRGLLGHGVGSVEDERKAELKSRGVESRDDSSTSLAQDDVTY